MTINKAMATFYPIWITPTGELASVTENETESRGLVAVRQATFMGDDEAVSLDNTTTLVEIGPSAAFLSEILVNGLPPANSYVAGNTVVFENTTLTATDVVQMTTSEQLSFSLLHGLLPPGMILSNSGTISGKVGAIPSTDGSPVTYSFAVRTTDGIFARDRQFTLTANVADPNSANAVLPTWGSLPTEIYYPEGEPAPFLYVPIGSTHRGNPFAYQISLFTSPGGVIPVLHLETFIGANNVVDPFNTLPAGLTLDGNTAVISGSVLPSAPLGKYFFDLELRDTYGNAIANAAVKTFMIETAPPTAALEPLRFIQWQTPAGLLATLSEAEVCPVGVRATCTTGEPVKYSIASSNMPLPPGLNLNIDTGDIEGVLSHIPVDQTFTFVIRAAVSDSFADRTFSIRVLSRYNVANFFDMNFKLRVKTSVPMVNFYDSVIETEEYFRLTDPNFSPSAKAETMTIFIAGGLSGDPTDLETTVRNSDMMGAVKLMLGEHKIAYAKLNNTTIYEVLYREVIDPIANAGGWMLVDGEPVEEEVENPHESGEFLHPASLKNIRYEFVRTLGFPAKDPAKQFDLTLNGIENLPLWMASPQTGNLISTIPGYVPAVAVAYLKPGAGRKVLDRIAVRDKPEQRPTDPADPMADGHVVEFDQYYMVFQTQGIQTTFDLNDANAGVTSWNIDNIRFDTLVYTTGKYYRMPRPGLG
jgi:hypothetical protein